jgi:hypothetical protein
MDIDPVETVESLKEGENEGENSEVERRRQRLNNAIAIMVALLATFMGITSVKAGNVAQAMAQAQAHSIDRWAWYQAKKTRQSFAQATLDGFEVQLAAAPPVQRPVLEEKVAKYRQEAERQTGELAEVEKEARGFDSTYERLNIHDDQFDFSDALLAIAISLFAVTALTQKRWLFMLGLVPTFFGVLYGLAGLFGLSLHSDFLAKLLGV